MRAATNAPRVGSAVAFEKATQNFQQDTAVETDKHQFNYNFIISAGMIARAPSALFSMLEGAISASSMMVTVFPFFVVTVALKESGAVAQSIPLPEDKRIVIW